MSGLRKALVALLAVATVLFAVGVAAERSASDTHVEISASQAEQSVGEEGEAAHEEGEESEGEGGHVEASGSEEERLLGVGVESTPLVVLAVLAGLGLAGLTTTRLGLRRGFLLVVAGIALVWAVLDVLEVVHLLDESRTGVALVAIVVAVLHLAAAVVAGQLARRAGTVAA